QPASGGRRDRTGSFPVVTLPLSLSSAGLDRQPGAEPRNLRRPPKATAFPRAPEQHAWPVPLFGLTQTEVPLVPLTLHGQLNRFGGDFWDHDQTLFGGAETGTQLESRTSCVPVSSLYQRGSLGPSTFFKCQKVSGPCPSLVEQVVRDWLGL